MCEKAGLPFGVTNLGDPATGEFTDLYDQTGLLNVAIRNAIAELRQQTSLIFIDFHSESREHRTKLALDLDGQITTIYGTHQHQQYRRSYVLPQGTGLFWDIGFTGFHPLFSDKVNPFSFFLSFSKDLWQTLKNNPESIPPHLRKILERYEGYVDFVKRDTVTIQGIEIIANRETGKTLQITPISHDFSL